MQKPSRVVLKRDKDFIVFIEDGKKKFRSGKYNYDFDLEHGFFARWGGSFDDDPTWSPFGPEILDFEITTQCSGIDGNLCKYCYKSNTHKGENTSYETFKSVIEKINYNQQLTQVAFGLGSTAEENLDLWDMCDYLRRNHIIPNGTVAQVDERTAMKIAENFGAVAVSYHDDFKVLGDTVRNLHTARNQAGTNSRLRQINIHFMIAEETFEDCKKLFQFIIEKSPKLTGINAVVLLGLKKCGRATKFNYNRISDEHFEELVKMAFANNIGIGFDSCSANRFEETVTKMTEKKCQEIADDMYEDNVGMDEQIAKEIADEKKKLQDMLMLIEPCESGLFSSYVNVKGNYYPCSFYEQLPEAEHFVVPGNDFESHWSNQCSQMNDWRHKLRSSKRSCPIYAV